ncbi:MAG: hypothetical protein AAF656_06605, partial [Planctomycetota bacterium]
WADSVSNARMGLAAFLRTREIAKLLAEQKRRWAENKPACHVCCDSWTMNKHFAAAAKALGIPVVYYVAPQAWASREGRVKKLAEVADEVACILPFEESWFRERGVNATFVGHPLFDERHGLPSELPPAGGGPIAIVPGSRASVVRKNLPRMVRAASRVAPLSECVVSATETTASVVRGALPKADVRVGGFDAAVTGCTAALTVSGTATLHTAALGVPMVAVYAGNPLLWQTLGKRLIKTRTFTLVNLLHGEDEHLIPEFIPWYGSVQPAAEALRKLIEDPAARENQLSGFEKIVAQLRGTDAAKAVAGIVQKFL